MQLNCKYCNFPIKSLIIDPDMAYNEISRRFMEHLTRKHKEQVVELDTVIKKCVAAYVGYLGLVNTAGIPESETWLVKKVTEYQDIVMASLGFDPEEEIKKTEVERMEMVSETATNIDKPN